VKDADNLDVHIHVLNVTLSGHDYFNGDETMAKVVVQMKVLPEGIEVDLKKLEEQINEALPEDVKIYKVVEEPIAFGLKCLKVTVLMPEAAGGTDPVENAISSIKEVSRVEVELVSRI